MIACSTAIMANFVRMERDMALNDMHRVFNELNSTLATLAGTVEIYSTWDATARALDAYAEMSRESNASYALSVFETAYMARNYYTQQSDEGTRVCLQPNVSALAFYTPAGDLVFASLFPAEDFGCRVVDPLRQAPPFFNDSYVRRELLPRFEGVVHVPEVGPMFVVVRPVYSSRDPVWNRTIHGAMLWALSVQERLQALSNAGTSCLAMWENTSTSPHPSLEPSPIPDIPTKWQGHPLMQIAGDGLGVVLRTERQRVIRDSGFRVGCTVTTVIVFFICIIAAAYSLWLDTTLLPRLSALVQVFDTQQQPPDSERVPFMTTLSVIGGTPGPDPDTKGDEIAALQQRMQQSIDAILARTHKAQESLVYARRVNKATQNALSLLNICCCTLPPEVLVPVPGAEQRRVARTPEDRLRGLLGSPLALQCFMLFVAPRAEDCEKLRYLVDVSWLRELRATASSLASSAYLIRDIGKMATEALFRQHFDPEHYREAKHKELTLAVITAHLERVEREYEKDLVAGVFAEFLASPSRALMQLLEAVESRGSDTASYPEWFRLAPPAGPMGRLYLLVALAMATACTIFLVPLSMLPSGALAPPSPSAPRGPNSSGYYLLPSPNATLYHPRFYLALPDDPLRAPPALLRPMPTRSPGQHLALPPREGALALGALLNPSPAVLWPGSERGRLERGGGGPEGALVLLRRQAGTDPALTNSVVAARVLPNGTLAAGAYAVLEGPNVTACDGKEPCGLEDPRAVVRGESVVVAVNGILPGDGLRCMAALVFDRAELELAAAEGSAVAARSMTWLVPPFDKRTWQKNWMPFFSDEGRLRFVHSIQPHTVVECSVPGTGSCVTVSRNSWRRLPSILGSEGQHLRGSTAVVDRGPGLDLLACGHWQMPKVRGVPCCRYMFFCYAFQRSPPHAITSVSRPFSLGGQAEEDVYAKPMQYLSGIALSGDKYLLTYSTGDNSTQVVAIDRDTFDSMVAHHKRKRRRRG
eukprot:m51a1_g197 hypothetical protein (987) ;mRNA; r:651309-654883